MRNRLKKILAVAALVASAAVPQANAAEFIIGSHLPLSGSMARVGKEMQEGILAAVEYYKIHAPRHTFKVLTIDDESQPAKAVAAVEKLIADGAIAFSAGYGTNVISASSNVAAKAGLVYMTSAGVGDGLTQRGLKTFFRISNSPGYKNTFVGVLDTLKVKSVSILYSTKEATSGLAGQLEKALPTIGVTATLHAYDSSTTDFKPLINKVKLQDRPEVLILLGFENEYVSILRAARLLKPDVKAIMGAWGLATPQMAKEFPDLMTNVLGTTFVPFPVAYKSAEGKEFQQIFQQLYGKDPDYLSQFGFVQTQLLFEAIIRAHDKNQLADKDAIANEMAATDRETLIGHISFDSNGDYPGFKYRMGQHQGDRIEIVWPESERTAPILYPAVPW